MSHPGFALWLLTIAPACILVACSPVPRPVAESMWSSTAEGALLRTPATLLWYEDSHRAMGLPDLRRYETGIIRFTRLDAGTGPSFGTVVEILDTRSNRLIVKETEVFGSYTTGWKSRGTASTTIEGSLEGPARSLIRILTEPGDLERTNPLPGELRGCDHPPKIIVELHSEGELPLHLVREANCRDDDPLKGAGDLIKKLMSAPASTLAV